MAINVAINVCVCVANGYTMQCDKWYNVVMCVLFCNDIQMTVW